MRGGAKTRSGGKRTRGGGKRRTRGGAKIRGGGKRRTRGGKRTRGGGKRTIRGGMWKRLPSSVRGSVQQHLAQGDHESAPASLQGTRRLDLPQRGYSEGAINPGDYAHDDVHAAGVFSRSDAERQQGQQTSPADDNLMCGCQGPDDTNEYTCRCGNRPHGTKKEDARKITRQWYDNLNEDKEHLENIIHHRNNDIDILNREIGNLQNHIQGMAAELHQLRMQGEAAADDGRRSGQIPEGEEDDGPGPGLFDRPQLMHSERMQRMAAADDDGRWGQIPEDAKDGTRW